MRNAKPETLYRSELVKRIERILPDCTVFRLDPTQLQGAPDLLILFEDKWAMLEVKMEESSEQQPNQEYYVNKFNEMSFAAFIYPTIESEVLSDLVARLGS